MQKFRALGAPPQTPMPSAAGGIAPRLLPPAAEGFAPNAKNSPPMRISGYAPALSSSVQSATNPTHKYSNCFFKYYTYICNNIPLQERLFSSCTYQKRKHEIKRKLKMIEDWFYRALNHESLNWLCGCTVYRLTNRCKIDQLFEIKYL